MSKPPTYALLDSGDGRKLEQFGEFRIDRPCSQAVWRQQLPRAAWDQAAAVFSREGGNHWSFRGQLPEQWTVTIEGLSFTVQPTDFGHLGVFPEHRCAWGWLSERVAAAVNAGGSPPSVLNLFAYSGGATLAAARAGAKVCHLDASKKMVAWARANAELNQLGGAPIRWIVDDVAKFLAREHRRDTRYDGIILDPPSFGRGTRQEVFKIDTHLRDILDLCRAVLAPSPLFVVLTCHTPGYTPTVLHHLLRQALPPTGGAIETGEMVLEGSGEALPVPSGVFAGWRRE